MWLLIEQPSAKQQSHSNFVTHLISKENQQLLTVFRSCVSCVGQRGGRRMRTPKKDLLPVGLLCRSCTVVLHSCCLFPPKKTNIQTLHSTYITFNLLLIHIQPTFNLHSTYIQPTFNIKWTRMSAPKCGCFRFATRSEASTSILQELVEIDSSWGRG